VILRVWGYFRVDNQFASPTRDIQALLGDFQKEGERQAEACLRHGDSFRAAVRNDFLVQPQAAAADAWSTLSLQMLFEDLGQRVEHGFGVALRVEQSAVRIDMRRAVVQLIPGNRLHALLGKQERHQPFNGLGLA
jgi:hypothetical protein